MTFPDYKLVHYLAICRAAQEEINRTDGTDNFDKWSWPKTFGVRYTIRARITIYKPTAHLHFSIDFDTIL